MAPIGRFLGIVCVFYGNGSLSAAATQACWSSLCCASVNRDVEVIKQPHGSRPWAELLVPLYHTYTSTGYGRVGHDQSGECALRSLLTGHKGDVTHFCGTDWFVHSVSPFVKLA
jgi:hypothetical protein